MADLTTLARPYAKAAFGVAMESNELENWSSMLSLAASVASVDTIRAVLGSPTLATEQLAQTLIDVCGDELDQKGQNFMGLLAQNKRLGLLAEISAIYEIFKSNQEKSVDVEITTAFEISSDASDKLAQALKIRLQRDINLASKVDTRLLGGAIIRAGDTVIDSSIKGKLNKLAEAMNS
ncbi:MAG: F0F1 ATP synthase subunit delta [Gammaproteobacteria bacterium]|nr:F0F1 ATP synthase subunit delta [Gammaproteobacteria bacterium]